MIEAQKHDLSRGYVNQLFKEHFFPLNFGRRSNGQTLIIYMAYLNTKKKQIDEAFKSRFH